MLRCLRSSNAVCDRIYPVARCMQQLFSEYPEQCMHQQMVRLLSRGSLVQHMAVWPQTLSAGLWIRRPQISALSPAILRLASAEQEISCAELSLFRNSLGLRIFFSALTSARGTARRLCFKKDYRGIVSKTVWPSGLRRWLQAPVRKGVGSTPTAVNFILKY